MADKAEFWELYKHPKWQAKRLEILERDKFTCQQCMDNESELQIHHKKYIRGNKPWEYDNDNFITYCKYCHEQATDFTKGIKELISDLSIPDLQIALGFVYGLLEKWARPHYLHKIRYVWEGHCISVLANQIHVTYTGEVIEPLTEEHCLQLIMEAMAKIMKERL